MRVHDGSDAALSDCDCTSCKAWRDDAVEARWGRDGVWEMIDDNDWRVGRGGYGEEGYEVVWIGQGKDFSEALAAADKEEADARKQLQEFRDSQSGESIARDVRRILTDMPEAVLVSPNSALNRALARADARAVR